MNAIRITRRLDSEHLYLPEIRPLLGKDAEIIVIAEDAVAEPDAVSANTFPLRGSVLLYEDPLEPVAESDWEAIQ